MRIYKGETGIELTVEAFLDLLEEDALDEAINMVLDLEATGSIRDLSGDYDGDIILLGEIDLTDFEGDPNDMDDILDHIEKNISAYNCQEISESEYEELFGPPNAIGNYLTSEEIADNLLLSNEDLRLKRIVNRFRHIT